VTDVIGIGIQMTGRSAVRMIVLMASEMTAIRVDVDADEVEMIKDLATMTETVNGKIVRRRMVTNMRRTSRSSLKPMPKDPRMGIRSVHVRMIEKTEPPLRRSISSPKLSLIPLESRTI